MTQQGNCRLVLLPGMDGTGKLFVPLLRHLTGVRVQVIGLPQGGPQDYPALAEYVKRQLPEGDVILLAESFSGGIAACLSRQSLPNLKGIIFVASFLSSPQPLLSAIASRLFRLLSPAQLVNLPLANRVIRRYFLEREASDRQIADLKEAITAVDPRVLARRLELISQMRFERFNSQVPAVCLQAEEDTLVGADKLNDFRQAYMGMMLAKLPGSHFTLNTHPEAGVRAILQGVDWLLAKGDSIE
ncbi:alpha/beta hydrolase [Shewanella corallii]|uniref:Alpha/beta hydrolase n=1 Tax=Shewanella corallii TaxID=560080 RepID=A0ABT0N4U4_9GAMM|nr:alpha/beta hydrolase [Shewanella corallii]MCL2913454.1 alpha/beta hydrolase [Shewanella corallii]